MSCVVSLAALSFPFPVLAFSLPSSHSPLSSEFSPSAMQKSSSLSQILLSASQDKRTDSSGTLTSTFFRKEFCLLSLRFRSNDTWAHSLQTTENNVGGGVGREENPVVWGGERISEGKVFFMDHHT